MIINTGGRTDTVQYYTEWLLRRFSEGYVLSRNPLFPNKVTRYELSPDKVDCVVFCSKNYKPIVEEKNITVVASYSKTVVLGKGPVIVGERINPTGKKKFKEALRNGDIDYILNEAFAQRDAGAHILDVNVGLPEIDECSTMEKRLRLSVPQ